MLVWARLWFGGCGSGFGLWAFLLPLPILVVPSAYLVLHSFELLSKFFSLSLLVCCGGALKWMNAHWAPAAADWSHSSDGRHRLLRVLQGKPNWNGIEELLVAGLLRRRLARRHRKCLTASFDPSALCLFSALFARGFTMSRYRRSGRRRRSVTRHVFSRAQC